MSDTKRTISRRNWLGTAGPVIAAAVVPAALNQPATAQPTGDSALAGNRVFNIRDFGAKGDGATLNTSAIQKAIDACTADQGGTVLVPAGAFLIGPIQLKRNVTLHIAAGGTLLGTADTSQYHAANGIPLRGDQTMGDGNVGLVYASSAQNVTLEGPGTIDGQGDKIHIGGNRRPYISLFYQCTNLTVRGIYMVRSAYHTCRIANCSYVRLDGIHIFSRAARSNNDGFHFISAEHVTMTNCNVQCQDDACALFGSCQFINITNCSFSTRWSCFRFGGGIAENVAISNCVIYQVFGCPIKLRCGLGSRYENMSFSNLIFQDVTGPISIGAGPQHPGDIPPGAKWPGGIVRNISFRNISGNVLTHQEQLGTSQFTSSKNPGELHSAIILNGVDGVYLEDISFSDIHLTFGGGGTAEEGARRQLPQIAAEYFNLGAIPAYGLYARNVHGLTLDNIRFEVATDELRPAVILDKVQDASISGLSAQGNPKAESLLRFMNTSETLVSAPRVLGSAAVFLRVEGTASRAITVERGDISAAETPLAFADGAAETAVKLRT